MFQTARAALAVALIAIAGAASAQTAAPAAGPQGDGGSADLGYRSAFAGYQRFTDEKVGSWKDANDNVGRIGGWRQYAREVREGDAPGSSPAPAGARPAQSTPGNNPSGSTPPAPGHGQH